MPRLQPHHGDCHECLASFGIVHHQSYAICVECPFAWSTVESTLCWQLAIVCVLFQRKKQRRRTKMNERRRGERGGGDEKREDKRQMCGECAGK